MSNGIENDYLLFGQRHPQVSETKDSFHRLVKKDICER